MAGLDYAVINKWFDWVMCNSAVAVDLIGMLYIVLILELSLICCNCRILLCKLANLSYFHVLKGHLRLFLFYCNLN